MSRWVSISAGNQHSCGVTSAADVSKGYCWGYNADGRLGDGTTTNRFYVPTRESYRGVWTMISAGEDHTCGIINEHGWCWGKNTQGEIGDGFTGVPGDMAWTGSRSAPFYMDGGLRWKSITAGSHFSCGVTTTGEGYCWGYNNSGQLGSVLTSYSGQNQTSTPTKITIPW